MKQMFALLFLTAWFSAASLAQRPAPLPRDDTQVWADVQFILPLRDKIDLVLVTGLRGGSNLSRLVDERGGVQLALRPNKYLTLTPGYLYRAFQPAAGRKFYEHWTFGAATVRVPLPDRFLFSTRSLYEYRFRHSQADTSRYRNRLQLERPVKIARRAFTIFLADEPWYDFKIHDWTRNRLFAGFSRRFAKKFAGEFFYMRQGDKRARPGDLNVIGATFRVNF